MTADIIKKYSKYSVPKLRIKAGILFRKYIRMRDEGKQCISCSSFNISQASHFYSAGHYPALEFNEDNVHASCMRCNYYLSGNLNEYRKKLLQRIGDERVEELDLQAAIYKRSHYKHDRYTLIEIIEKYKELTKIK